MNTSSFLSGGISHSTSTATHYYSKSIDDINTLINSSGIPTNAEITSISVNVNVSFTFHGWVGTMRAYYSYGFGGNGSISTALLGSTAIHTGSTGNKDGSKSHSTNIKNYLSSAAYPFALSKAYGSYFTVSLQSDNILSKTMNVDSVTLTIEWAIPKYSITLNKGTGCDTVILVGGGTSGTFDKGTVVTFSATNSTGYKWGSWSDGNTTQVGRSITLNGNVNLTANFVPITYNIGYHGSGATGTMNTASVKYNEEYTIAKNSFTPKTVTVSFNANGGKIFAASQTKSYSFEYWIDGYKDKTYNPGDKVKNLRDTDGATVTLQAKWKAPTFTLETITRDGYTFNGWYCEQNGLTFAMDATLPATSDLTFSAIWIKDKIENVYGGATKTTVYVGVDEIGEIYVGNTVVYG